jgi:hypothetical protein
MALVPPANDPPIADAGGQHSQAWAAYFQDVADWITRAHEGVTDGSNAEPGHVGEYLTTSSSIALASATPANAAVLGLTAGDWDVWGRAEFVPGGGTLSQGLIASASSVSNTLSGVLMQLPYNAAAGGQATLPTGTLRLSLSADGNAYLVVYAVFTVGTMACNGTLEARRVR